MAEVFTKTRPDAPPGFFAAEAAGLEWLRVPGGATVPAVVAVGEYVITMTRVDQAEPTARAARRFGVELAITHDAGAPAFGAGPDGLGGDGYIGDAALTLRPHQRWGEFYAVERVLPYAHTAHSHGALSTAALGIIEALAQRLIAGEFDDEAPPARIHGDLWAGNVLFTEDSATLIDPAAHGGHRLTDLAMLSLFGVPFLGEIVRGYGESSAHLPTGWPAFVGLHQLHPLLVHAVLFGPSFGAHAARLAQQY